MDCDQHHFDVKLLRFVSSKLHKRTCLSLYLPIKLIIVKLRLSDMHYCFFLTLSHDVNSLSQWGNQSMELTVKGIQLWLLPRKWYHTSSNSLSNA